MQNVPPGKRDSEPYSEWVLPVVIGALGTVPKKLESNLRRMGTNTSIELIQKTDLLGTARILRKVLEG